MENPSRRAHPADRFPAAPSAVFHRNNWLRLLPNKHCSILRGRWVKRSRLIPHTDEQRPGDNGSPLVVRHAAGAHRFIIHPRVSFIRWWSLPTALSKPRCLTRYALPIQYALTYPERVNNPELPKLDWDKIKELTFEPPDLKMFPCLELARQAAKMGGTSPAALCAATK